MNLVQNTTLKYVMGIMTVRAALSHSELTRIALGEKEGNAQRVHFKMLNK